MLTPRASRTLSKLSNVLVFLSTICVVGLSCVAFLSQAVRTAPDQSWHGNTNALVIGASYIVVLVSSVLFCIKRRISVHRRLQLMSSSYEIVSRGNVPDAVHEYIMKEYARVSLIAHVSVPKDTIREGWGRPGTQYYGLQFRYSLMKTVPAIDALARLVVPSLPKLKPHVRMLYHFRFLLPLFPNDTNGFTPLHYYDTAIQIARNSSREPTEAEFEAGIEAADEIIRLLDGYRLEMMLASSSQDNISISEKY